MTASLTLFGRPVRRIHCVGAGGMGVGPLAIYLSRLGFTVTGEDDAPGAAMRGQLERAGVRFGPVPADCDLVMHSSAVAERHPARRIAAERNIPLVRRGELLAEVTRDRKLVAVCGSHGKTTTTALLITALRQAGFPAGYVLGGLFNDDTPPAAAAGDWVVAEVDESDGTIEHFHPEITVAVNLDWDHADRYRRREDIEAAFAGLFLRTRTAVLVSDACAMTERVVGGLRSSSGAGAGRLLSFGRRGDFQGAIRAEAGATMTLQLGGRFVPREAIVRARGDFNAANATGALAAAQLMGASISERSLAGFPGVRRRQSVLSDSRPLVIEDYAHHPAEIQALLASLKRQVGGDGRLLVMFQPHRHSRTAQFKGEFATALSVADRLFLLDVYSAGEAPVPGGATADIVAELRSRAPALAPVYSPNEDAACFQALGAEVRETDVVAFVGAGNIDQGARAWLASRPSMSSGSPHSAPASPDWDAFHACLKPQLSPATKFTREEPLAPKTTMKVGGSARLYAEPSSLPDLQALLQGATARQVPVFVLGRGSNLIVPDDGVNGLVLSLAHEAWASFSRRPDGRVWVGAGLRLKNLCGLAAKAGLAGFEFLEGIPASVGGALRMNAGAMGGWIFDVVEEVQLITLGGTLKTLPKAAMHVDYRHCAELHDAIALGALLRPGAPGDGDAIKRQMDAYARKRHESQPREPSAGCIFKNPPGTSAGRLIDECGLKGRRVGDAEISPVHANFIVNRGRATSADILELVRQVRARVRERRGIDLQPEVLLYGRTWEEVL